MSRPASLQARLALAIGLLLALAWIAAAAVTAVILRTEMDEVFDSALAETAQRLLPLAVVDIIGRDDDATAQRLAPIRGHDEFFTYIVRDGEGRVLLQSHAADPAVFPPWVGPGFGQTATHRLYSEEALRGTVRITVAEPLAHRDSVAREVRMGLGLPLVLLLPVTLAAVVVAVRTSLRPLRRFRDAMAARGARDLSPVASPGLPREIAPVAETVNALLARLKAAFEAERSFAASAAHELRTPLAGALAQAQRLRAETPDPAAAARAGEIEATLKRLTRLAERLMQLARAEGGRLRLDHAADLSPVARIVVDEIARGSGAGRIALNLPDGPVLSDLDPDAFGILARNLIDNALRHGAAEGAVTVRLAADGRFSVANDGPVVPPEVLARLTGRFERGGSAAEGSGLGLAIAAAIAEGIGSRLTLASPRPGSATGFEAALRLPLAPG